MKKIALLNIFLLIFTTSLIKNSTKKIEDKIFALNESIRSLKVEFGDVMLEYNFLSSPEKLIQSQSQYFKKDLMDSFRAKILSSISLVEFLTNDVAKINTRIINNATFFIICLRNFQFQLNV